MQIIMRNKLGCNARKNLKKKKKALLVSCRTSSHLSKGLLAGEKRSPDIGEAGYGILGPPISSGGLIFKHPDMLSWVHSHPLAARCTNPTPYPYCYLIRKTGTPKDKSYSLHHTQSIRSRKDTCFAIA